MPELTYHEYLDAYIVLRKMGRDEPDPQKQVALLAGVRAMERACQWYGFDNEYELRAKVPIEIGPRNKYQIMDRQQAKNRYIGR